MTIFGAGDFCGYFFGVTSKLDNFYGLFLQIKCSGLHVFCDEIYTITHLKRHLNMILKVHYRIFLG